MLIDDTIDVFGVTLFRVKALISFGTVKKGDLGGYVEKEDNLYHSGNAWVSGDADYIVFKNHWSSGRYFTYTRSNKMWKVGCFFGIGQELIEKAYQDSKVSGKYYEACVKFVEKIEEINNEK